MMAFKTILVLATSLLVTVHGYKTDPLCPGSGGAADTECEAWSDLRYLWSPGTVTGYTNNTISLDTANLPPGKVSTISMSCVNKGSDGSIWYGRRVAYGTKKSVVALYDLQGSISGLQARYAKSTVNPSFGFLHSAVKAFQSEIVDNVEYWVITVYFVDPKTICSAGRPAAALKTNNGVGDRLMMQIGPDPTIEANLQWAPRRRSDALNNKFSNNMCFPTMGVHTFFNVESYTATGCKQIFPWFLLFNKAGYLIGFGCAWVGQNPDTDSFESPPVDAIQKIVGPMVPQCLLDTAGNKNVGVTTMHVFFVNRNPSKNPFNC